MVRCPTCSAILVDDGGERTCPSCQTPPGADRLSPPTTTVEVLEAASPTRTAALVPGATFAGRYRVVARIGAGGMGEVYRAEDLTLGQTVALKILRAASSASTAARDRFIEEVRLARDVSHPNVCRVYDIGQSDSVAFLSMEFVDGETLAQGLARRAYPADVAIDIARQLCAGLAAAHDRGVLHRDIKPSNIMIDKRGRVRLMDFGIAVNADTPIREQAGTPGYVAPELVAGGQPTRRSDLYALGVVMRRLFADRREPVIDAVIRRCLAADPKLRPASALEVAAMLPGGDAVAAALARGRLPSPEAVTVEGDAGARRPAAAVAIATLTAAAAVVIAQTMTAFVHLGSDSLPQSPARLAVTAETILRTLAPLTSSADHGFWFELTPRIDDDDDAGLRRTPIRFVYRASADPLVPKNLFRVVSFSDPPANAPGTAVVVLDPSAHLLGFIAMPAGSLAMADAAIDWSAWFAASGLTLADYTASVPMVPADVAHDVDLAWERRSDTLGPRRIAAATLRGLPTYFIVEPGPLRPPHDETVWTTHRSAALETFLWVLIIAAFVCAATMAAVNIRRGVGHRLGGFRLGLFVFAGGVTCGIMRGHHVPNLSEEVGFLIGLSGWSLVWGSFSWLAYVAIEPSLRRFSPMAIRSLARVLDGRPVDPAIGHDVALGAGAGVVIVALMIVRLALVAGRHADEFVIPALESLRSWRDLLQGIQSCLVDSVHYAIAGALVIVVVRWLVRSDQVAVALFVLLVMPLTVGGMPQTIVDGVCAAATATVIVVVFLRRGLLALAASLFVDRLLTRFPVDLRPGNWMFGHSLAVTAIVLAVALVPLVIGVQTRRAGRPAEIAA